MQADPAQDQRAHDPLAEVRFGDDQRAQLIGRHEQRLDIVVRVRIHQRGATGERPDLAEELAMAVRDERHDVSQPVALAQRHPAAENDEHPGTGLAGGDEALAARVASRRPEAADARDLGIRQLRKHLMAPGHDPGGGIVGHGRFRVLLQR